MLQLSVKSELASLTGDRGEQKRIALGVECVSAREKRNPSGHPQEIVVNTFTAFTGTRGHFLEDFSLAQQRTSACISLSLTWKQNCI